MTGREGKVALGIAVTALLICVANLVQGIYLESSLPDVIQTESWTWHVDWKHTASNNRFAIGLVLIVSILCVGLRNLPGLIVSILALVAGIFIGLSWLSHTAAAVKETAASGILSSSQIDYLHKANWKDILVLCLILVLIVWEIKILVRIVLANRRMKSAQ